MSHDLPLVDPFEFPLFYNQSFVLVDGGRVPLDDLWRSTGRITTELPAHPQGCTDPWSFKSPRNSPSFRSNWALEGCWSRRFQWLPCEFEFAHSTNPDNNTLGVRIASYVNGLHPYHHRALYTYLEQLKCDGIQVRFSTRATYEAGKPHATIAAAG